MDIVKELAATNMKISDAKNILFKLQEDETVYLEIREKKALAQIEKILDESKELLDKTHENYDEIHDLCVSVCSFADFLTEAHGKFQGLLETYKESSDRWDAEFAKRHAELAEIKKNLAVERSIIENEKKGIEKAKQKIKEAEALIESRQQQIRVALQVLEKKQK